MKEIKAAVNQRIVASFPDLEYGKNVIAQLKTLSAQQLAQTLNIS